MKILHVNNANYGGGLEQYLAQLFDELHNRGHENLFLYGEKNVETDLLPDTHCFHISDITCDNCTDLPVKLDKVQQIINQEDPDLVYFHQVMNLSLIQLLMKNRPSVRFTHGHKLICPDGRNTLKATGKVCPYQLSYSCSLRAYRYRCMPRNFFKGLPLIQKCKSIINLHKKHSFIVTPSKYVKAQLLTNGFNDEKIEVIPYFTQLTESQKVDRSGKAVILCLGRVVYEKGMHFLLEAFAELDIKAQLVIIGDGPMLEELKVFAESLGILKDVTFTGWLQHGDLVDYYREASVVVVPSISPETFGIVGIEAMAHRRPVVAFDMGGISEWLVDGKTGFLVAPRDSKTMAQKIRLLLDRPDLAEKFGDEGRKIVKKRFLADSHLPRLMKIFDQAILNFEYNRR